MPTYQYQCTECGEGLEAVQKFTDDALTVCPNCEGRLKKVFSAVGIVFKGSGFYRNDSRRLQLVEQRPAQVPAPRATADRRRQASSDKTSAARPTPRIPRDVVLGLASVVGSLRSSSSSSSVVVEQHQLGRLTSHAPRPRRLPSRDAAVGRGASRDVLRPRRLG